MITITKHNKKSITKKEHNMITLNFNDKDVTKKTVWNNYIKIVYNNFFVNKLTTIPQRKLVMNKTIYK